MDCAAFFHYMMGVAMLVLSSALRFYRSCELQMRLLFNPEYADELTSAQVLHKEKGAKSASCWVMLSPRVPRERTAWRSQQVTYSRLRCRFRARDEPGVGESKHGEGTSHGPEHEPVPEPEPEPLPEHEPEPEPQPEHEPVPTPAPRPNLRNSLSLSLSPNQKLRTQTKATSDPPNEIHPPRTPHQLLPYPLGTPQPRTLASLPPPSKPHLPSQFSGDDAHSHGAAAQSSPPPLSQYDRGQKNAPPFP